MAYTISKAQPGEAEIFAHIQTESWKAAFRGILKDEDLVRYTDLQNATRMYRSSIAQYGDRGYLLRVDGTPHAIAWWGDARDPEMSGYAELICIHSLPDNWHRGYGRALMTAVLEDMKAQGYEKVMLWVFTENHRARSFYEAVGYRPNGMSKRGFGAEEMCYERALF